MKRYITSLCVLFAAAATASAQTGNPSVTVTHDYDASIRELDKQMLDMQIPDSIRTTVATFDYTIKGMPYNGSYKFSPYNVKVNMPGEVYRGSHFYLKGGAGYVFRPELTFFWEPFRKTKFKMAVYQNFSGYGGEYFTLDNSYKAAQGTAVRAGHDYSELFGIECSRGFGHAALDVDVHYNGIYASDAYVPECAPFHEFEGSVGVSSYTRSDRHLAFDARLLYRLSRTGAAGENLFCVEGGFTPQPAGKSQFKIDYAIGYNGGKVPFGYHDYFITASPRIERKFLKVFDLRAGVNISYIDDLNLFPELKLLVGLFKNSVDLYAGITGGESINSFSSLKNSRHHFVMEAFPGGAVLGGTSLERIRIYGGLRGCIADAVQYDLQGGYRSIGGGVIDRVNISSAYGPLGGIGFATYNMSFADLCLAWEGDNLGIDGGLHYRGSNLGDVDGAIDYAPITADLAARWNYLGRIFAGATAEYSSARQFSNEGVTGSVPGWVDLGLEGEYFFSRSWSVWLRMGNLLGQKVQREIGYIERGISATAGISLKLR